MGKSKYGCEIDAMNFIHKNRNGVNVDLTSKLVTIALRSRVGIKTWGAIDYLSNERGFRVRRVNK